MNVRSKARWLLATATVFAVAVWGNDRSSANYAISTEVLDAGGVLSTSSNFSNVGSLGAWSGISTEASSSLFAKNGYVGQLYERVGLNVSASSENVGEGETRQLRAEVRLDDETFLAVENSSVAWSVDFGPVSVDHNGLVTAEDVFREKTSLVKGQLGTLDGTLGLRVLNTDLDNYGEFAGDGIDDSLQTGLFAVRPFVNIDLSFLPSGDVYFELEGSEWTLFYSENLEPDSWQEVEAGAFFTSDGNGWCLAKETLSSAWFLRARLKP